jgi:hypothetical protein
MSERLKNFCWSCGGKDGYHYPGCDNAVEVSIHSPENPPPHCGEKTEKKNFFTSFIEADRICCSCGKSWRCTYNEWVAGPCPNCGAKGYQP